MQAPFIRKIKHIMEDLDNSQVICWSTDKTKIEILNQKIFQQQILPKNFRHHKLSSFIRQLNLYGFKKVRSMDHQIFTHSLLEKGLKIEHITHQKKKSVKNSEETFSSLSGHEALHQNDNSKKETHTKHRNSENSKLIKQKEIWQTQSNQPSYESSVCESFQPIWVFPFEGDFWQYPNFYPTVFLYGENYNIYES